MKSPFFKPPVAVAALILTYVGLSSAQAADFTWSGLGSDANFTTGANWVGGVAPAGGGSTYHSYLFQGSTPRQNPVLPGSSTSTSNWLATVIKFDSTAASYNLGIVTNQTTNRFTMGASSSIIQDSANDQVITATIRLAGGVTSTVSGTGSGNLTLQSVRMGQNSATLELERNTTIHNVTMETANGSSKISVKGGAVLTFGGATTGELENLHLGVSSAGVQAGIKAGNSEGLTSSAALRIDTAAFTGENAMTFSSGVTVVGNNNKTITFSNTGGTTFNGLLQLGAVGGSGSRVITVAVEDGVAANFNNVSGSASTGTTSMRKTGAGTLLISGSVGYNGATRVEAGTLRVEQGLELSGDSELSGLGRFETGGNLSLLGNSRITVGHGANEATGSGVGTFEIGGAAGVTAVTFASTASIQLDIWSSHDYERLVFDSIDSISLSGTLNVASSFQDWTAGQEFTLFDWGGVTLNSQEFSHLVLPDLELFNLAWDTSNLYSTGAVRVTAIPETSTYILLGLGGVLLMGGARLRSREGR